MWFPLKKNEIIETVEKIAKDLGKSHLFKDGKPGQKWYKNFLKRHPEISLREAETVNRARAIITEQYIRTWFRDLKEYLETNKINDIMINPARVFNGDESGFSLCPKSGKVLAPKGWKNLYTIKLGQEKDNITTLVVFSADGEVAPPLVVFPYVRPPKAVVENMPPKWVLDGYDMKNHIINGFRKCGLFPLDPKNVDFTKCVQNIIVQQNELNVETNDPLTSDEIRAAEKVILRLRNKLIPRGVNVDLIFDGIKILENEALRQIVIEVGDMIPLDDVTIIPYDNIYVQNDNINQSEPIASTSSFSSPHFKNKMTSIQKFPMNSQLSRLYLILKYLRVTIPFYPLDTTQITMITIPWKTLL
ncbi:hypothetical protein JTB14_023158 [Gonioctena quinquepunctata]|nr:hypothetical protein JTB14_023158 [Gonioctena quinquepunctata]